MKRLFVCEFITCGGMRDRDLPDSLLVDAELMYDALLTDLRKIEDLQIITCRDDRLPPVAESVTYIAQEDNVWQHWQHCMDKAELAWLIAPETDGVLLRLNKLARQSGCELIGCDDDAVELTTSKLATNQYLLERGVPALISKRLNEELLPGDGGWVVKLDDGAGSEECYFFQESEEVSSWKKEVKDCSRYIQQRYISGTPASMSVLYTNEKTNLLSCNRQVVQLNNGMLVNKGILPDDLRRYRTQLEPLAVEVGKLIPGLHGYVGIDLVLTKKGPVVIEINPRLTTSYAGLSEALNINVAELIINALSYRHQQTFHDYPDSAVARAGI